MAKELTLNFSLAFNKSNVSTSMASGVQQLTVSGTDYVRETWSVPTSVTAIPLGAVATPGYVIITNKDASNFVDIYDGTSGNACVRLMPGEWAAFRFKTTAPAAKADTAPVKVEFLLLSN